MTQEALHRGVYDLACSYYSDYKLVFPPLNPVSRGLVLARKFGLPGMSLNVFENCFLTDMQGTVEVLQLTSTLLDITKMELDLPVKKHRLRLVDIPEVCLVSAMILVVRHSGFLCSAHPFEGPKGPDAYFPFTDWKPWLRRVYLNGRPSLEDGNGCDSLDEKGEVCAFETRVYQHPFMSSQATCKYLSLRELGGFHENQR